MNASPTKHRIIHGDSTDLSAISDNSIDLVITSPPYPMIEMWDDVFSSQDPRISQAIMDENGGLAFELMHEILDRTWSEVFRTLKEGGMACINIGDATRKVGNEFRMYPNYPRIVTECLRNGFTILPGILWRKQTNSPNKFMGSGMLPAGAYVTLEHEHILILRKGGVRPFRTVEEKSSRRESAFFWEERNLWFSDLWNMKGEKQATNGHEARKELERNQGDRLDMLTPELIASGEWKGKTFRSYDLNSTVGKSDSGFLHPITLLVKRIREIFLSMGFTEMKGHYIEYAGWNMDALFIPQGHPARELQDTFYLETEREGKIEHPEVMGILKKTHESGMPGYTGWGYSWSQDEAKRQLLRTHTTVSTIRYLYEHPEAPQAVFSVDKVFRHESVDWKHLAELYQIEGAVCSKDANLSTLKWIIREFYSRLGFEDLKFIPSYYPYTEPSIDTVAVIRGKEVELGGSGIFRPEVTKPLGIKEPVMAWGLGLERLAMLYYGLDDIREIYQSDIDWLRTFRIKL